EESRSDPYERARRAPRRKTPLHLKLAGQSRRRVDVRFGSEEDVPVDDTARLLDYQEPTSPIVVADVRLGPEAELRQVTLAASINHERKPLVLSKLDD